MSEQPTSEDAPVASSSSAAPPTIKFKFGVDPNLILNEPRKRPREGTYSVKPVNNTKQEMYQEPAFVIEKGQKLIDALKEAREDEYTDGRLLSTDFMQLPDRDDYPDYYSVIKTPLAFNDIEAKLQAGGYSNVQAVKVAIEHCFWNAKKYNQKGSTIFEDAKYLHKFVKRKYIELVGKDKDGDGESGSDEETPASKKAKKAPDIWQILKVKLDRVINKKAADLSGRWLSTEFMDVPSKADYPDYHAVIKKPRAFQTILDKLKAKTYTTPTSFVRDTDLIFSNAQHYNQEESQISQDAEEMKILFHQLVDPIVKEYNANGGANPIAPPAPPKIKIKVGGQQSGQSKTNTDANPNLVQAAVNQANMSLLSAVAAITGEDPDAQDDHSDEGEEEDPPSHYEAAQIHLQNQQANSQQPSTGRKTSQTNNQPQPNNSSAQPPSATSLLLPGTSTPQQPTSAPTYRALASLPVPVKPRPGPPVLSSFVLTPKPGSDKERLTLRNERGVRAHAITLREVAEVVEMQITIRDFVPPPKGSGASPLVAINGWDGADGAMEVDQPMRNGSASPSKAAGGGGGKDHKTYSLFVSYNGMPVDPLPNSPSAPPPAMGVLGGDDDGTHERAPPTAFKIVLGGAGQGGGMRSVGSIEVFASWREVDGATGAVVGSGRESYEVVVRRG